MRHWFYLTETQRRVAIPEADFFPLAEAGVIVAETMVWTEGMGEWVSLGEIHPELFGDPRAMAPVDLPTVLQMVRTLSAPMGRAAGAVKAGAVSLIMTSVLVAGFLAYATVVAVENWGGYGWMVLCGLPLALLPALLAFPLFPAMKFGRRAHGTLDRGAFYAESRAMGRYFWIVSVVSAVVFMALLVGVIFAIIYRVELVEFIQRGGAG